MAKKIRQTFTLSKDNIQNLDVMTKNSGIKKSTFIDQLLTNIFLNKK